MKWRTEVRKISELKEWDINPRVISDEALDELMSSIDDLGNFEPLVIDTDGTVIAGNQRLKVAQKLNETEVEVSVPERKLTAKEIKKIGVISNRHSGEWDMDKLASDFDDILEELEFEDLMPEIVTEVEEDDYEEPDDLETTVELGDVYQLGEHRLMCGDSTKIEDVEKLMNGEKADMVFTDPPYNIAYEGGSKKRKMIENDIVEDFYQFLYDMYVNLIAVSKGGASIYVTHSDTERVNFTKAFVDAGFYLSSVIIWVKNNATFGRQDYKWKHEPILYGWNAKGSHKWEGRMNEDTTWMIDRPSRSDEHPTMKPIGLVSRAINNSSKTDDLVLDVFGGSGSTLIACEQTNRKCYMMELDPHYCQVIIDRWEKLTSKEAKKL